MSWEAVKDLFDPEARKRKRSLIEAANEKRRREEARQFELEVGELRANPIITNWMGEMLAWGEALYPGAEMDDRACYWMRRGLELSVAKLDERIASAEDNTDG